MTTTDTTTTAPVSDGNVTALRQIKARNMKPTLQHRPAIWENMLGTLYAFNGNEVRYFGYDHADALAFAGVDNEKDLRWYRNPQQVRVGRSHSLSKRTLVLYVLKSN